MDPLDSQPGPSPAPGNADARIAELLARAAGGEQRASADLLPLVYDHLRAIARAKLAREPAGQTLQPTALVHEAYLKLIGSDRPWNDKRHFFAAAALAMRRILVDRARARRGEKRGGNAQRISLDIAEGGPQAGDHHRARADAGDDMDWLALENAMAALEQHDPGLAEVVHLRYFAGLSVEEVALATGVSSRTVNREWLVARAWLLRKMQEA